MEGPRNFWPSPSRKVPRHFLGLSLAVKYRGTVEVEPAFFECAALSRTSQKRKRGTVGYKMLEHTRHCRREGTPARGLWERAAGPERRESGAQSRRIVESQETAFVGCVRVSKEKTPVRALRVRKLRLLTNAGKSGNLGPSSAHKISPDIAARRRFQRIWEDRAR